MTSGDADENADTLHTLSNRPTGWRGFARDMSGWEILRALGRTSKSREEADKVVVNAPIVISSVTSFLVLGWGLIALGSFTFPRAGYGVVALLGGLVLYRISSAFSRGARWALPFVAMVPLLVAGGLYWWLQPSYPLRDAFDAGSWLLIATFALADLTLLFGSVHPSWEAKPWE